MGCIAWAPSVIVRSTHSKLAPSERGSRAIFLGQLQFQLLLLCLLMEVLLLPQPARESQVLLGTCKPLEWLHTPSLLSACLYSAEEVRTLALTSSLLWGLSVVWKTMFTLLAYPWACVLSGKSLLLAPPETKAVAIVSRQHAFVVIPVRVRFVS